MDRYIEKYPKEVRLSAAKSDVDKLVHRMIDEQIVEIKAIASTYGVDPTELIKQRDNELGRKFTSIK